MTAKLTLKIDQDAEGKLARMCNGEGIQLDELLRRALATYQQLLEHVDRGGDIILRGPTGDGVRFDPRPLRLGGALGPRLST